MLARVMRRRPGVLAWLLLLVAALAAAGCFPLFRPPPLEQRTTQGPTAREIFNYRVMSENGREPTFEERRLWDSQIDEAISAYLRKNQEKANALDVSQFRYYRQATVGM